MFLAAAALSSVPINAYAADMQTLPAAIVTAQGKKPAPMIAGAVCEGCDLDWKSALCGSCAYCIGCQDCGSCEESQGKTKHFTMLVKTNMLYDAALTPNVGLEIGLGKGWSIGGNVMYGWWSDRSRFYWRAFATELGVRKYFGSRALHRFGDRAGMAGHHVGLYAGIMTYDFELGGRGYICDYREDWGRYAGIDYGYSLPVTRNLNIDFTVGMGYAGGQYKEYLPAQVATPEKWHYVWQSTDKLHYFGPTKMEISLVWRFSTTWKKNNRSR